MYAVDIKDQTLQNTNFRKVLHTGEHSQIVAMCLPAGEDIGLETHAGIDQLLFIVQGQAEAVVGEGQQSLDENDVVVVPAGTQHNITNVGDGELKLFTVYAPANHPDGTIHATKADAEAAEAAE